jgi:hypothetical protein
VLEGNKKKTKKQEKQAWASKSKNRLCRKKAKQGSKNRQRLIGTGQHEQEGVA